MTTYIYNDDVKTTLLESIDETSTTIKVANPRGVYRDPPNPGSGEVATLKIVDRVNEPTRREVITYTGRNTITGGYELTGVTRGESLTTALPWEADSYIIGLITASATGATGSGGQSFAVVFFGVSYSGSSLLNCNNTSTAYDSIGITVSGSPGSYTITIPSGTYFISRKITARLAGRIDNGFSVSDPDITYDQNTFTQSKSASASSSSDAITINEKIIIATGSFDITSLNISGASFTASTQGQVTFNIFKLA